MLFSWRAEMKLYQHLVVLPVQSGSIVWISLPPAICVLFPQLKNMVSTSVSGNKNENWKNVFWICDFSKHMIFRKLQLTLCFRTHFSEVSHSFVPHDEVYYGVCMSLRRMQSLWQSCLPEVKVRVWKIPAPEQSQNYIAALDRETDICAAIV